MSRFSAKLIIMKDSLKFAGIAAATLLVIAALVVNGRRNETVSGTGSRVDVRRVEQMAGQGKLSLRPAEFGKPVEDLEDGVTP
jgi:hypothetical protein